MKRGPTGLPAWLVQRASAVLVLLFLLFVLGSLWRTPVHSHADWMQWLALPGMRIAIAVFFVALLAHMWVGLRDVLLDHRAAPACLNHCAATATATTEGRDRHAIFHFALRP